MERESERELYKSLEGRDLDRISYSLSCRRRGETHTKRGLLEISAEGNMVSGGNVYRPAPQDHLSRAVLGMLSLFFFAARR